MATLSRRARTEATRQATEAALVRATIDLLDQGTPFAELGVEAIARHAGYSRPTFYAYFRDKRELVLHLGTALEAELAAAADPWLQSNAGDLRETLAAVFTAFANHRATVRALVEAATYDPEVAVFWRGLHERFVPNATKRIRTRSPDIDARHAKARAWALVWMTERTITEHLANPTVDQAALLDELSGFWAHATGG